MFSEIREKIKDIGGKELRVFGFAWAFILSLLSVRHYYLGHTSAYSWHLISALAVFFLAVVFPVGLKPVLILFKSAWTAFVWLTTRGMLILFYYLVITPIGLIMKMTGNDPLDKKIEKERSTYWIVRESGTASRESLERQF
ncbi:MAG: hypothetical protein HQL30_02250 [Candidatus Omnitrophica bacterium]|nr:hypothetical protein [Candidatus Omnitrophota bacterium]